MEEFLSLTDASKVVHLPERYLYDLAKKGKIASIMFQGNVLVNKESAERFTPIWNRAGYDATLAAQEIGIVEASEKYRIPHPTISRWAAAGRIRVLKQVGRKRLISEGDIKYLSSLYHEHGGSQGRWIFGEGGSVYHKKGTGKLG